MERSEVLERIDLAGENLQGISLGFCDLRGKNFRGADLSFAHLGCADLRGADLRNANLFAANLGAADMRGADLRYSDLRKANLEGTQLVGADLREGFFEQENLERRTLNTPWVETEEYKAIQEEGFYPVSHWGEQYRLEGAGTLYHDKKSWTSLKKKLGILVFGDRETFEEVRLVQQYQNYAQWAYMVTRKGFERMVQQMGIKVNHK